MSVETNPYMSSSSVSTEPPLVAEEATGTRRFWTFVIDFLATRVVLIGIGIVYGLLYGDEAVERFGFWLELAISTVAYVSYYFVFEWLFGRTVGKALLGTRVVTLEGMRPSVAALAIRSVARMIPLEPLSITLADRWWHDSLSKTKVVRVVRRG